MSPARRRAARNLFCALLFAAIPAVSLAGGPHSVSTRGGDAIRDCRDLRIEFGGRDVERAEETITVGRGEVARLSVTAAENGGVDVSGWDRDEYAVTACKVAAGDSPAEARELLGRIALSRRGSDVGVDGPDRDEWVAFLIVRTPRGAQLSLDAQNGPVSARSFDGSLRVSAENGPVSVSGLSGELDVKAVNGPVSVEGGSGTQRVRAENGPLTVRLSGDRWNGEGLDARTENGPVSLKIPDGYRSGVEVSASSHTPFRCKVEGCPEESFHPGRWNEAPRRFQLGNGETLVRISTVNGPLTIGARS